MSADIAVNNEHHAYLYLKNRVTTTVLRHDGQINHGVIKLACEEVITKYDEQTARNAFRGLTENKKVVTALGQAPNGEDDAHCELLCQILLMCVSRSFYHLMKDIKASICTSHVEPLLMHRLIKNGSLTASLAKQLVDCGFHITLQAYSARHFKNAVSLQLISQSPEDLKKHGVELWEELLRAGLDLNAMRITNERNWENLASIVAKRLGKLLFTNGLSERALEAHLSASRWLIAHGMEDPYHEGKSSAIEAMAAKDLLSCIRNKRRHPDAKGRALLALQRLPENDVVEAATAPADVAVIRLLFGTRGLEALAAHNACKHGKRMDALRTATMDAVIAGE